MIYALYVLGSVAALIVLVVIVAMLRPGGFRIDRSQLIAASPQSLFPYINDLRKFQEWSPYKEKDPHAHNEFSGPPDGPGAVFRWEGNGNVGAGMMKIVDAVPDRKVSIDLQFLKPFQAHNKAEFTLTPQNDQTLVTWSLSGCYGLVPKIMGMFVNMDRMIGNDFEHGLKKLKALAERG